MEFDLELYARYWTLFVIGYLPMNIAICNLLNYGLMNIKSIVINRKILQEYDNKEYLRDMFIAILLTPLHAIIPSLFDYLNAKGYSNLYNNFDDHSLIYFFGSIFFVIFLQDFWHYWAHRFSHTNNWYYKHIHIYHHATTNVQAGTTFKMHPLDIFLHGGYLFIILMLPIHVYALAVSSTILVFLAFYYHSGFEILPRFFSKIPPQYLFANAVGHNFHHTHQRCHYALYLGYTDYLFNSERPEFREKFKEMTQRPYFTLPEEALVKSKSDKS